MSKMCLSDKLAKAELVMTSLGISEESHVRWCVFEAVRKRHYESVSPTDALNTEGKENFYKVMNHLTTYRHI